jgi:hypothetical protein
MAKFSQFLPINLEIVYNYIIMKAYGERGDCPMNRLNKRGFTLIEAVASIFIITLIMTTAISIIINVRNQSIATNNKILATEVGTILRDDLINDLSYTTLNTWMAGLEKTVNHTSCVTGPVGCGYFSYQFDGLTYSDNLTIVFYKETSDDLLYHVIHFAIIINYYSTRDVTLTGIIYE